MKEFISNNKVAILAALALGVITGLSIAAVKMFTIEPAGSPE